MLGLSPLCFQAPASAQMRKPNSAYESSGGVSPGAPVFSLPVGKYRQPELHVRGGTEENSQIIFLFSRKTYVVTPH